MLAPIIAQHVPLIRDYLGSSPPTLCVPDPNYVGVGGDVSGGDPFWSSVVLLMRLDGTNGATVAPDTSSFAHTTQLGSGALSTASSKFGTASLPAGSSFRVDDHPDFDFGTGDLTIEMFVYLPAGSVSGYFFGMTYAPSFGAFLLGSNGSFGDLDYSGPMGTGRSVVSTPRNQWSFVVYCRAGGRNTIWVDGAIHVNNTNNTGVAMNLHTSHMFIGANDNNTGKLAAGYVDEVRITKGVARYTIQSPPPTAASFSSRYAEGSIPAKTALSLHFDGANGASSTVDSSTFARSVSTIGSAVLSTAQKKAGSASGAPGSGGGWSVAASDTTNFGTADFTIEAWLYASSFYVVPGVTDPYSTSTILLLRADGANGGTTFVDSSVNNATINRFGSPTVSTAQSHAGGSSIRFNGGGDYLRTTSGLPSLSGPYTIDCWVRFDSIGANRAIFEDQNTGAQFYLHSGGTLRFYQSGDQIFGTTVFVANTWYHVALSRDASNNFRIHVNGVNEGGAYNYSLGGSWGSFFIGVAGGAAYMLGYIDDFRITSVCRYTTASFTPESSIRGSGAGITHLVGHANNDVGTWKLAACADDVATPRKLQFIVNGASVALADTAIPLGAWTHVVAQRASGVLKLYQNGFQVASVSMTSGLWSTGAMMVGGSTEISAASVDGYIDEVKLTRAVALYVGTFTPPTLAYCNGLTGTADPVPSPPDSETPSGLRFDVIEVPCLDVTDGVPLSSTVIANIDTASSGPQMVYSGGPIGLTPTFTWVGPTAGTLRIAGTASNPGTYRLVCKFYENNSLKVLGTSECDITVWPAAGTFSPGPRSNPTGRVGVPATLQLTAPSANYDVAISVVSSLAVPGMSLVTAWTPGVTSSGTVSLVGTPTAPGTYNLVLTYRRSSTCEIRDLATSTHTVTIGALVAPPAPAPAPAPSPSPAPAPAPTPPGISNGPVPDNLWSSVSILQQWTNSREVFYETGDSSVAYATFYMDATGTHEMTAPLVVSGEGAGDIGSAGASSMCYVGGSRWGMGGNLTVECFYRMSAADSAALFGASSDSIYMQLMSLFVTGGPMVWSLGVSSVLVGGRRVVRPTFIVGRSGGPAGSTPIMCFGAEIAPPAFAFFHFAGQRVASGATDEIACWFNGVGGAATKISTSGGPVSIGPGNTFKCHGSFSPNGLATGGVDFNKGRNGTGLIDQLRVTKAQRYTATAGITNAISRDKITPPFSTS